MIKRQEVVRLPCPVCGQSCRAEVALKHKEACPKHPLGCYGHPHTCGCADVTSATHLMKLIDVIYGASSLNMTPEACSKQSRRVAKAILKQFNVSLKTTDTPAVGKSEA